jgi:hypothetical protein
VCFREDIRACNASPAGSKFHRAHPSATIRSKAPYALRNGMARSYGLNSVLGNCFARVILFNQFTNYGAVSAYTHD